MLQSTSSSHLLLCSGSVKQLHCSEVGPWSSCQTATGPAAIGKVIRGISDPDLISVFMLRSVEYCNQMHCVESVICCGYQGIFRNCGCTCWICVPKIKPLHPFLDCCAFAKKTWPKHQPNYSLQRGKKTALLGPVYNSNVFVKIQGWSKAQIK